jgi:hypothetical protein
VSAPVPESEGEALDVDITYEPDDDGIKITAVLGESSIIVEHSWDAVEHAATLVQALPSILIAVQTALNDQEANRG